MIHLETINPNNWRLNLKVSDNQKKFVSDSNRILARAFAYRDNGSQAFVIYDDETPIGMAMYYELYDAYDFSQFFIDERYQGKGYGYKSAELILQKMKESKLHNKVILCYVDGDDAAKNLYLKLGFCHTGESDGNEIVMEKILD